MLRTEDGEEIREALSWLSWLSAPPSADAFVRVTGSVATAYMHVLCAMDSQGMVRIATTDGLKLNRDVGWDTHASCKLVSPRCARCGLSIAVPVTPRIATALAKAGELTDDLEGVGDAHH